VLIFEIAQMDKDLAGVSRGIIPSLLPAQLKITLNSVAALIKLKYLILNQSLRSMHDRHRKKVYQIPMMLIDVKYLTCKYR
jgi:hypothetical protein